MHPALEQTARMRKPALLTHHQPNTPPHQLLDQLLDLYPALAKNLTRLAPLTQPGAVLKHTTSKGGVILIAITGPNHEELPQALNAAKHLHNGPVTTHLPQRTNNKKSYPQVVT